MSPTQNLLFTILWSLFFALLGHAALRGLLGRKACTIGGLLLAPAFGMALMVLLATVVGWTLGTRAWIVVPLTLPLGAVSLVYARRRLSLVPLFLLISAALSVPPLSSVYRSGAFVPYNDTFTYLAHGQWLQNNAFSKDLSGAKVESYAEGSEASTGDGSSDKAIGVSPLKPTDTQVAFYQRSGLRMGGSFLLGWMQAATGVRWSLDSYLPLVASAGIAGALAVAAWIAFLFPGRRWLALGCGLALGCSYGGFSFGTIGGFMPQMVGLTLGTAFLAWTTSLSQRIGRLGWRELLCGAILLAAAGYAYSELLPFLVIPCGLWFLVQLVLAAKQDRLPVVRSGLVFLGLCVALWNVELLRIKTALVGQSSALVGWAVDWSSAQFLSHAIGLKSGSSDADHEILPAGLAAAGYGMLLACGLVAGLRRGVLTRSGVKLVPAMALAGLFLAAFLYFRFGVDAPWPVGQGHTWNQFKIANWGAPVALILAGIAWVGLGCHRVVAILGVGGLLAFAAGGIAVNLRLGAFRSLPVIMLTGRVEDPLGVYRDLRAAVLGTRTEKPVYLDLGGVEHKSRQMAAYFLSGVPVVADWSDDGYILPSESPAWSRLSLADCEWMIRTSDSGNPPGESSVLQFGRLQLARIPPYVVSLDSVTSQHDLERSGSDWWVWVERSVDLSFGVRRGEEIPALLEFEAAPVVVPMELRVEIERSGVINRRELQLSPGWSRYQLKLPEGGLGKVLIRLRSDQPPQAISKTDGRLATFSLRNAQVIPEPGRHHGIAP